MHSVQKYYPFFGSFGYIKELLSNAYLIQCFCIKEGKSVGLQYSAKKSLEWQKKEEH